MEIVVMTIDQHEAVAELHVLNLRERPDEIFEPMIAKKRQGKESAARGLPVGIGRGCTPFAPFAEEHDRLRVNLQALIRCKAVSESLDDLAADG